MSLHCPALLAISVKLGGYPCCLGPHTGNQRPLGSSLAARTRPCPLSTTRSTLGAGLCQDWLGTLEDIVENIVALERFLGSRPHLTTPNDLCWSKLGSFPGEIWMLPAPTHRQGGSFFPPSWLKNLFLFWGNTGLLCYASYMCTTLHFHFCMHYRILIIKHLVSVCHHKVDPLTYFCLPPTSPLVTTTLFSVSMCLFLFGLFIFFVCLFFTFYM